MRRRGRRRGPKGRSGQRHALASLQGATSSTSAMLTGWTARGAWAGSAAPAASPALTHKITIIYRLVQGDAAAHCARRPATTSKLQAYRAPAPAGRGAIDWCTAVQPARQCATMAARPRALAITFTFHSQLFFIQTIKKMSSLPAPACMLPWAAYARQECVHSGRKPRIGFEWNGTARTARTAHARPGHARTHARVQPALGGCARPGFEPGRHAERLRVHFEADGRG